MNTQTRSTLARFLGNRAAVVTAGTVGFMLGAGGFVAAQHSADDTGPVTTQVDTTVDDTIVDATVDTTADTTDTSVTIVDVSVPDSIDDSSTSVPGGDDATSTSLPGDDATSSSVPGSDDATSSSVPGDDDATSSSVPGSDDATSSSVPSDDDATSTSLPGDDDDDDATSTSVPAALPAPFSETYQSSGGSISVSWSGSTFSIDSITPAAGFAAEIEDNSWDKVRVDFESAEGNSGEGHNDSRIEVRLHEGTIRVRID